MKDTQRWCDSDSFGGNFDVYGCVRFTEGTSSGKSPSETANAVSAARAAI